MHVKADPEYVPKACQRSLDRLGVDYIDLYYLHRCIHALHFVDHPWLTVSTCHQGRQERPD